MNFKMVGIVLLSLALGLGAGIVAKSIPFGEDERFSTGDFEDVYEGKNSDVVLFSVSTCPHCKDAKALLDSRGIAYVERVIDKSEAAKREAEALGIDGVPVLYIGDYRIQGFNAETFVEAIRLSGKLGIGTAPDPVIYGGG